MNNIIPIQAQQPIRPRDYNGSQLALIRRTVAADCNDDEFNLFIEVSRRIGLDPFRRHIYAVVYNKKDDSRRKMSIITGIDGFRAVAARNRDYRPDDQEPMFEFDASLKGDDNPLGMRKAVVRAYKLAPNNEWHPVVGVAYWGEFVSLKEDCSAGYQYIDTGEKWPDSGKPKMRREPKGPLTMHPEGKWATMPHVMLGKCAEAQALRKGWPEDLSGVYVQEEMQQAEVADAAEAVKAHEVEQRLARINAVDTVPVQWNAGDPITFIKDGQFADEVLKFIRKCESPVQIEAWMNINRVGMQQYWALHKADAFELKKQIEARTAALNEPVKEKKEADKLL